MGEPLLCVKCWVQCDPGSSSCAACGGTELIPVGAPRVRQILAGAQPPPPPQPNVIYVSQRPKQNTGDAIAGFIGKLFVAVILVGIIGAVVIYCGMAAGR